MEKPLTADDVDFDDSDQVARYDEQVDRAAQQNINRAIQELRDRGALDEKGEWVKKDLPPDMRDDSDCDL